MSHALGLAYAMHLERELEAAPARHRTVRPRPAAPVRWSKKIWRSAPIAFHVARRVAATPLGVSVPKVGDRVGLGHKRAPGRIEEVIVGMDSGRTTVALSASDLPSNYLLLVPAVALTTDAEGHTNVDPQATVAIPRELALADR